jgi:phosphoribosylaminoimidazole-succinocarboxamide synthase
MQTGEMLYEGKAKKVYLTSEPDELIQFFKDDATAFNAQKKGTIHDKGIRNNQISEQLFRLLEERGVSTHFLDRVDERSMRIKRLKMIPLEVVVRNVTAGSLSKRLGLPDGKVLSPPLVELYYKDDSLGDPLINEDHVRLLGAAEPDQLSTIKELALKINGIMVPFFDERNLVLVDFKLEFGIYHGTICLGDEIGPDTCRLWDKSTRESLDKDRFRKDLGKVEEAYAEVYRRVCQTQ